MKRFLCILLVLVMALSLTGCAAKDYKNAVKTMEAGDYAAAAELFRALSDHKDSAALAQRCDYLLASEWMDEDKLADASAAFKALGEYEDSAALAQQCDYKLAVALFDAEDYAGAIAAFEALGDYEDSADYIIQAGDRILAGKLVGNWTHTMQLEDMVNAIVGIEGLDLPPLEMVMTLEVDEELNYSLSVDEEQTRQGIQNFIDGFGAILLDMVRDELAAYDLTMEDALPEFGVSSEEELLEMLLAESGLTVDTLMVDLPAAETGSLEIVNGVIQVNNDGAAYEASYDEANDSFTLVESVSVSGFDMEYTIDFTRK